MGQQFSQLLKGQGREIEAQLQLQQLGRLVQQLRRIVKKLGQLAPQLFQQLLALVEPLLVVLDVSVLRDYHDGLEEVGEEEVAHHEEKGVWLVEDNDCVHLQHQKLWSSRRFGRQGWSQEEDKAGGQKTTFLGTPVFRGNTLRIIVGSRIV